jgi:putative DNA primase/helicase
MRGWLEGFADELAGGLADARPVVPDELDGRAADAWEPLLAIAELAGGNWPDRAASVAVTLATDRPVQDETIGVRLLADVRAVFDSRGTDAVFSKDIVEGLCELEEAGWDNYYGRKLAPADLGRLLKRYEIRSRTVRVGDDTAKGFKREQFADAWRRYLST